MKRIFLIFCFFMLIFFVNVSVKATTNSMNDNINSGEVYVLKSNYTNTELAYYNNQLMVAKRNGSTYYDDTIFYFVICYDGNEGYYFAPYNNLNLRISFINDGVSLLYLDASSDSKQKFLIENYGDDYIISSLFNEKMFAIIDEYEYIEDDSFSDGGYYANYKKPGQSEYIYNSTWKIEKIDLVRNYDKVYYYNEMIAYDKININNLYNFTFENTNDNRPTFAYRSDVWEHIISVKKIKYGKYGMIEIKYSVLKLNNEYNESSKNKFLIFQEIKTHLNDEYSNGYSGLEWKNSFNYITSRYKFKEAYLNNSISFTCHVGKKCSSQGLLDYNSWSNEELMNFIYPSSQVYDTSITPSFEIDHTYQLKYEYATKLDMAELRKNSKADNSSVIYNQFNQGNQVEFGFMLIEQDYDKMLDLELEMSATHSYYDYHFKNKRIDDEIKITSKIYC